MYKLIIISYWNTHLFGIMRCNVIYKVEFKGMIQENNGFYSVFIFMLGLGQMVQCD